MDIAYLNWRLSQGIESLLDGLAARCQPGGRQEGSLRLQQLSRSGQLHAEAVQDLGRGRLQDQGLQR